MENTTPPVITTTDSTTLDQIKLIELIHIVANFISFGVLLSIIGVATYMLMNKEIKNEAKNICYDIINFNLSFTLYSLAGFLAIFILVGRFDLPVIYLAIIGMFFPILYFFAWVFFMIVGAVKHFAGERYAYPMVIQFIK